LLKSSAATVKKIIILDQNPDPVCQELQRLLEKASPHFIPGPAITMELKSQAIKTALSEITVTS
jgi:hypothetical protein